MSEPTSAGADPASLSYDEAFAELQAVVGRLEEGDATLEATIERYERAVALQRRCEELLAAAELRVRQLATGPEGGPLLAPVPEDPAGR